MLNIGNILKKKLRRSPRVSPEDVFLDTQNLPGFDTERLEGRLEGPIRTRTFAGLGIGFGLLCVSLFLRALWLGGIKGKDFALRAEHNHLQYVSIVPPRGVIYDRNLHPLAFNMPGFRVVVDAGGSPEPIRDSTVGELASLLGRDSEEVSLWLQRSQRLGVELSVDLIYDWETANKIITRFKDELRIKVEPAAIRSYLPSPAISQVIGYTSKVTQDDLASASSPYLWPVQGRAGIELKYDEFLRGTLGKKIVETDSKGRVLSENVFERERMGGGLVLSVSADLEQKMYDMIGQTVRERGFRGGSAVMLDIHSGEILGMVSYPGFDLTVVARGKPTDAVRKILGDPEHPLFNRALVGAYPPGSTIKPFIATAAVQEQIIDPAQDIFTIGKILVPNPYDPKHPSVFLDWKDHGWVNMYKAIAVSSNAYFYTIGGGANGIAGLGVTRLQKYFGSYGFGSPTGVDLPGEEAGLVPSQAWKAKNNPQDPDWRIGDTYHMSIGQGGMLVTPLQMARALTALVGAGEVVKPRLLHGYIREDGSVEPAGAREVVSSVPVSVGARRVAEEGMLRAVKEGTAIGVSTIGISVGAKTGTAQFGPKDRVHSWFIGFAPFEQPEVVLVVTMESGPVHNLVGGTFVAGRILDWYAGHKDQVLGVKSRLVER